MAVTLPVTPLIGIAAAGPRRLRVALKSRSPLAELRPPFLHGTPVSQIYSGGWCNGWGGAQARLDKIIVKVRHVKARRDVRNRLRNREARLSYKL